ncbi:hypothetical protein [Mycobacterium sp.]|uniref:hypothetical protein n=1 Tax=Mycobacterium sp. TaxID=1785 RepID=UPI0025D67520|nr:hypothetical protein [Mycobacterium sp.]
MSRTGGGAWLFDDAAGAAGADEWGEATTGVPGDTGMVEAGVASTAGAEIVLAGVGVGAVAVVAAA